MRTIPEAVDADEFAYCLSELGDLMRQHELPKPEAVTDLPTGQVGLSLSSEHDLIEWEQVLRDPKRATMHRLDFRDPKIVSRGPTPGGVDVQLITMPQEFAS